MGNISSVNLKSSQKFNPWHNVDIRPPYAMLTDANNVNLFGTNSLESLRLKEKMIKQAEENYKTHCKARNKAFQAKSYEWSAVVNLNETHTAQDLQKLVDYFANTHGFQCYQAVIHRDEGHLIEKNTGLVWQSARHFFFDKETGIYYKGECKNPDAEVEKQIWKKSDEILAQSIDELTKQFEIKINHHAHLEFITLDKETGKNHFRGGLRTPKALSAMQTEVAKILGMNRGNNYYEAAKEAKKQGKKIVKPNRMEGRAYATISTNKNRKLSEQKEAEKAQNREREQKIEKTLDSAHKAIQEKNATIATLKGENENLKATIKELKADYAKERKQMIDENKELEKQGKDKIYTQQDYSNLKNQYEAQIAKIKAELENERKAREKTDKERDELRSELHRAQQESAQNREISQSSSVANIEHQQQESPQITKEDEEIIIKICNLLIEKNKAEIEKHKFYDYKISTNKLLLENNGFNDLKIDDYVNFILQQNGYDPRKYNPNTNATNAQNDSSFTYTQKKH